MVNHKGYMLKQLNNRTLPGLKETNKWPEWVHTVENCLRFVYYESDKFNQITYDMEYKETYVNISTRHGKFKYNNVDNTIKPTSWKWDNEFYIDFVYYLKRENMIKKRVNGNIEFIRNYYEQFDE